MGVKSNVQGISIAPLKSALAYADNELGITVATSSYSEICQALSDYFPEFTGEIYTNGTQNIPLDNNGYAYSPSVPANGGATLGASYFTFANVGSNRVCKSIVTDSKLNLRNYNTLNVMYSNAIQGVSHGVKTLDISAIDEGYITCAHWYGSYWYEAFLVSSAKVNFGDSAKLDWSILHMAQAESQVACQWEKIWLE